MTFDHKKNNCITASLITLIHEMAINEKSNVIGLKCWGSIAVTFVVKLIF